MKTTKKAKCKKCKKTFDVRQMVKVIEGYSCGACWNEFVDKEQKKMTKVYCKNCKWFRCCGYSKRGCAVLGSKNKYFTISRINHKGKKEKKWKNKKEADRMVKKYGVLAYDIQYIECCNFNIDYDCKYYTRKWHKFWLKK